MHENKVWLDSFSNICDPGEQNNGGFINTEMPLSI